MKPTVLFKGRSKDLLRGLVSSHLNMKEAAHLINIYESKTNTLLKNKGKVWTGKYLKQLYVVAHRYAMEQHITPIPFTKCNKKGFPKDLIPYKKFLEGTPGEKQSVLTLLCQYRLFHDRPDYTVESIVRGGGPNDAWRALQSKWLEFLPLFKERNPVPKMEESKILLRGSSGPNGPSMTTILKDAYALTSDPEVFNNVKEMSKVITSSLSKHIEGYSRIIKLSLDEKIMSSRAKYKHSRIAFLPEGGLKTRVIAIGDYFTQELLKPLHDSLMKGLRGIPSDGTYSHDKIGDKALSITRKGRPSYCYDLSNATDRFPCELIAQVLSAYYGENLSSAWKKLMVDRDFYVNDNLKVRYAVGQPMGFYSSWPAFAITHHALVQFSAYLEGIKHFQDYMLIGDDIVINHPKVAGKYRELLIALDVPISLDKSIVPIGNNESPSCEIAKRLFYKGEEISPIPPDIIKSASSNYLLVTQMIKVMYQRGFFTKLIDEDLCSVVTREALVNPYPTKIRASVVALLSNPLIGAGAPTIKWGDDEHPWKEYPIEKIEEVTKEVLRELLDKKVAKLLRELESFWFKHQYSDISPIFVWAGLPVSVASTTLADNHPMLKALGDIVTELEDYSAHYLCKSEEPVTYNEFLDKLSYIPDLKMRAFRSTSKKREYIRSSTALEVLKRLKNPPVNQPQHTSGTVESEISHDAW